MKNVYLAVDELDDRHLNAMLGMADEAVDMHPNMTPEQWIDKCLELVVTYVGG